jgi:WD40 repeat protein
MCPTTVAVLLLTASTAADLPPHAILRLGDPHFRAGKPVFGLVFSPDGKHFATHHSPEYGVVAVTVWNAESGQPVHSGEVNADLFVGFAWGRSGGFAVIKRADPGAEGRPGKLVPDDFRVWDFANPEAKPPAFIPLMYGFEFGGVLTSAKMPKSGPEYTEFAVSADGTRVAAIYTSKDGKHAIHVFELKPTSTASKLTLIRSIDATVEHPGCPLISPNGSVVVTFRHRATGDYEVRAWDVNTGKAGETFRVPYPSTCATLSPDGSTLAVAHDDGTVRLVDPMTGKKRGEIAQLVHTSELRSGVFAFTPDGERLLVVVGNGTFVVDVETCKVLAQLEGHSDRVMAVTVSADGKLIGTADLQGLIRIWDAKTLRALTSANGHRAMVEYAELSPNGKRILTWAKDETVRVWDIATGKELRAFGSVQRHYSGGLGVEQRPTFTPDSHAVVFNIAERLLARDVVTGLEVPLPGEMAELKTASIMAFAPDGKAVLTWYGGLIKNGECELAVWDWPTGKKRFGVEVREIDAPGFSPDGSVVFAVATSPSGWDAKTGKTLLPAWTDDSHTIRALTGLRPNPRLLLDAGEDRCRVIGAGNWKALDAMDLVCPPQKAAFWSDANVVLCPTGRQYAVSGRSSDEICIYEAATGNCRRKLVGHRGGGRILGFTPDGTRLLTACTDHTVLVWDVRPQSMPLPDEVRRETSAAKLWATMCVGKADAAYLAMVRLAAEPGAAAQMARLRLKPATAPSLESLDNLLLKLGDSELAIREAAERELDGYGEPAAEMVELLLANIESADAKRVAGQFVRRWLGSNRQPVRLADSRAIELLESLGTPEARTLLKELAAGEATAWRTREAKRALTRISDGSNVKDKK